METIKEEQYSFPEVVYAPPYLPPDFPRLDFIDLGKQDVLRVLISGGANKVDIPAKYTRDCDPDRRIRAVMIQGLLAPFLLCDECGALYQWYKLVNGEWKNQSGIKSMKLHLKKLHTLHTLPSTAPVETQPPAPCTSSAGKLSENLHDEFRVCAVEQVIRHPGVSFTAAARLISSTANFAARVTHRTSKLYDFTVTRTDINNHIVQAGINASHILLGYYKALMTDKDVFPSTVLTCSVPRRHYGAQLSGGLIVCGLDRDWSWFSFPIRLEYFIGDRHSTVFTWEWFQKSTQIDEFRQAVPLAVTTTDEPKLKTAFDRKETCGGLSVERYGCVEHALSESISEVFGEGRESAVSVDLLLMEVKDKLSVIEQFYSRDCFRHHLRVTPMDSSITIPWKVWYHKLTLVVNNFAFYREESYDRVTSNLQPLSVYKSLLEVLQDCKDFFEIFEKDGPNSHLSFLSYIMLDMKLFSKSVGLATCSTDVSKIFAENILRRMEKHLWPYCGSSFALTAATLSGLNLVDKITSLTQTVCSKVEPESMTCAESWKNTWMTFSQTINDVVMNYMNDLVLCLSNDACDPEIPNSNPVRDNLLSELFVDATPPKRARTCLDAWEDELARFRGLNIALQNPVIFFASCGSEFRVLKKVAKYVLSIRVSSGRLDSMLNSGLTVRKLRRKMRPSVVRSIVYSNVCRQLMEGNMLEKYSLYDRDISKLNVVKDIHFDSTDSESD